MAKKYYTISDGYYREEYPMHTNLDVEKFYATQRIEQNTTFYDLLGDNLADYLLETILPKDDGTRETWEVDFLEKMQILTVFYVAASLEDFNSDSPNDRKVSALRQKIQFYKKKVKDFIADTSELVVIQGTDTEPVREDYQGFPTHFYR